MLSIRTVNAQDPEQVEKLIRSVVESRHADRGSRNRLEVTTTSNSKWWSADPASPFYQAAATSIKQQWHMAPQFVCEGGTQRVAPMLEDILRAPMMHFPLAQSSSNAHLPNECMKISNLLTGVSVLRSFFCSVSELCGKAKDEVAK